MIDFLEQEFRKEAKATSKPVSGEHLEVLGKRAAALFVDGVARDLSSAVVEAVKEAGLSSEQVLRVIEFANTDAYLREFKKEGMPHRIVSFETGPADPDDVLKRLSSSGASTVLDHSLADYNAPPREKYASAHHEEAFLEQFREGPSSAIPFANPFVEVMDLRDKLAGVHGYLTSEISSLANTLDDVQQDIFREVKQAALSGAPLSDIVAAWEAVSPNPDLIKIAFERLSRALVENEVFRDTSELVDSLEKRASSQRINPAHPVVTLFQEFCEVVPKLASLRQDQLEVGRGVGQLTHFLKEATVQDAFRAAKGYAQKGGVHVKDFANMAVGHEGVGKTIGDYAQKAVEYAPEAAVGLAGLEAYKRLAYNPTVQSAQRVVMRNVPGTQAWDQHVQGIQAGVGDPAFPGAQYGGVY